MTLPSAINHPSLGPPAAPPDMPQSRRALFTWTSIIVGLLCLQIGLCVVGVILATRTNPPVVKDYYNKAVHWDDRHRPPSANSPAANPSNPAGPESRP